MDLVENVVRLTGATQVEPVAEGHQSRVFEVMLGGEHAVAKVLDAALVDATLVLSRVQAVAELAELDARVCRPIPIDGRLLNTTSDGAGNAVLVLCFEFAAGVALDLTSRDDAAVMGATLAGLHRSLARITPHAIPEVAALRAVRSRIDEDVQLLHGDFNAANLRREGVTVRVFDFEDCGYGPRSFEIANALYMALFAWTVDGEADRYPPFEDAFLAGYATEEHEPVDRDAVDRFVDLRVRALGRWLDDLSAAPIGIRTATPEWRETLRSFVGGYEYRVG